MHKTLNISSKMCPNDINYHPINQCSCDYNLSNPLRKFLLKEVWPEVEDSSWIDRWLWISFDMFECAQHLRVFHFLCNCHASSASLKRVSQEWVNFSLRMHKISNIKMNMLSERVGEAFLCQLIENSGEKSANCRYKIPMKWEIARFIYS